MSENGVTSSFVFRPELNEQFLDTISDEGTKKDHSNIFANSKSLELRLNKNLFAFENDELRIFFSRLDTKTPGSFRKKVSVLKKYFEWAKEKSLIERVPNLKTFNDLESYINVNLETDYIEDRNELYRIAEDERINRQDAVLLVLAYEGVHGKGWKEIFNLEVRNCIFETNTLILCTGRKIMIPERSMNIIRQAIDEKEYRTKETITNLHESDYVIKPIKLRNYVKGEALRPATKQRIDVINVIIGEITGKIGLNGTTVANSGMIDYIKHLHIARKNQDLRIEGEDFKKVRLRYGKNISPTAHYGIKSLYNEYWKKYGIDWFCPTNYIAQEHLAFFQESLTGNIKDNAIFEFELTEENNDLKQFSDINMDLYNWNDADLWDGSEEARKKLITHFIIERNREIILTAKRRYAQAHNGQLECEICKFNFKNCYGEIGENFIEGHHIIPLSVIVKNPSSFIADINNIMLVCSNCHRMLHREKHWLDESRTDILRNKLNLSIDYVFGMSNL